MNCKVYITDEGWGPLVRESALVEQFRKARGDMAFTVQTHMHAGDAARVLDNITVCDIYNNIQWAKTSDGSPDIPAIKAVFADYMDRSEAYIDKELDNCEADFVISDFVYEAFVVASQRDIPSFGVAHFTWDWFFSKMFPSPVRTEVLEYFTRCAEQADALYFPPFTPKEILRHYRGKAVEVPLVVRELRHIEKVEKNPRFKVLIMDSGTSVLATQIQQALAQVAHLPDFHFYMSSKFRCEEENVTFIDPKELFSDYMPHMDLVITRAGFNTISECIAYRTPLLLIGQAVNPEMQANMLALKEEQLGSFLSMNTFVNNLVNYLPHFVDHEYKSILKTMEEHEMPSNGAEVIVEDILNRLEDL